jgi:predicted DCC family thiol-disulfide oxidoreductase YuxK
LKRLKFASLQSLASSHHLKHAINLFSGSDTIIFYDEGRYYIKSTAVLKIAGYLRFPYNLE